MKKLDDFSRPAPPLALWDVLLIPAGTSVYTVRPEQTQRITVQAESRLGIDWHPDVRAYIVVGWAIAEALPTGRPSALAFAIRERAQLAEQDARGEIPESMRQSPNRVATGLPNFGSLPASMPTPAPPYRRG